MIIRETKTYHLSSFVSGSYESISGQNNPIGKDETSSDRATVGVATGSGASAYAYWAFDCSDIPAGATIISVTCNVKASVSSTSYISTRQVRMYRGTTAMGSNTTISATAQSYTLSVGTWTRDYLQNARIRIYGARGSSSTSSSASLYLYGATLTVTYEYGEPTKIYQKDNGAWSPFAHAYKKVSGVWEEQTTDSQLLNLFEKNKVYLTVPVPPMIYVNTTASSATATMGGVSIQGVRDGDFLVFVLPDLGTYTITASDGRTKTVNVSQRKAYYIALTRSTALDDTYWILAADSYSYDATTIQNRLYMDFEGWNADTGQFVEYHNDFVNQACACLFPMYRLTITSLYNGYGYALAAPKRYDVEGQIPSYITWMPLRVDALLMRGWYMEIDQLFISILEVRQTDKARAIHLIGNVLDKVSDSIVNTAVEWLQAHAVKYNSRSEWVAAVSQL